MVVHMTTETRPLPEDAELVVGEHDCPVCAATVLHLHRPGRGRIYCTNACRQRAYRWRRAHGVRLCVERDGPTERMHNFKRHALRDRRDPVGSLLDHRRREVTVCGLFAKPARHMKVTHTNFLPDHPFSCRTCAELVGASTPHHGVPPHLMPLITYPPR
jgi:hypothetical protein